MGKVDLRPARLRQTANQLLRAGRLNDAAPWMTVLNDVPPGEILTRTRPVRHHPPKVHHKKRKPSKIFQPQTIVYEEDHLRNDFFKDHPWELARPRSIVESDGKDYQRWDWSRAHQPGRPIDGESVVQRQMWLMNSEFMSKGQAYDVARKELYDQRHLLQMEARIAREEAQSTGALFHRTANDVGMQIENATFDKFKEWAQNNVTLLEQARSAAYTGSGQQASAADDEMIDEDKPVEEQPVNQVVSELAKNIPGSRAGQKAYGGVAVHP